jgi:hypothetical protein
MNGDELRSNLDRVHTTPMGAERIKGNLFLDVDDPVEWCKDKISSVNEIIRRGKNWYIYVDDCVITVNARSFTVITAHQLR